MSIAYSSFLPCYDTTLRSFRCPLMCVCCPWTLSHTLITYCKVNVPHTRTELSSTKLNICVRRLLRVCVWVGNKSNAARSLAPIVVTEVKERKKHNKTTVVEAIQEHALRTREHLLKSTPMTMALLQIHPIDVLSLMQSKPSPNPIGI